MLTGKGREQGDECGDVREDAIEEYKMSTEEMCAEKKKAAALIQNKEMDKSEW